jgi:crotonobetaine/carnitine-CoA ligase
MLDEVPVAFVLVGPGSNAEGLAERIVAACTTQLAKFKCPHEVRVVTELPRSTLEKVAKAQLRQRLLDEAAQQAEASTPD